MGIFCVLKGGAMFKGLKVLLVIFSGIFAGLFGDQGEMKSYRLVHYGLTNKLVTGTLAYGEFSFKGNPQQVEAVFNATADPTTAVVGEVLIMWTDGPTLTIVPVGVMVDGKVVADESEQTKKIIQAGQEFFNRTTRHISNQQTDRSIYDYGDTAISPILAAVYPTTWLAK
jgi:hypothetical protein